MEWHLLIPLHSKVHFSVGTSISEVLRPFCRSDIFRNYCISNQQAAHTPADSLPLLESVTQIMYRYVLDFPARQRSKNCQHQPTPFHAGNCDIVLISLLCSQFNRRSSRGVRLREVCFYLSTVVPIFTWSMHLQARTVLLFTLACKAT